MKIRDEDKMELMKDFHNQFSDNYNHQQSLFVSILTPVAVVFSGYAYVLVNTINPGETPFSALTLPIVTLITIVMLSFLSFILISQGWGFRSSQKIVLEIRKQFLKDEFEQFFGKFGTNTENLPDFYGINLWMLEILKFLATGITFFISFEHLNTLVIFVSLFSCFTLGIQLAYYYSRKKKVNFVFLILITAYVSKN